MEYQFKMKDGLKVLEFLNPVFRPGENLTTRYGYKWAGAKVGEKVYVARTGDLSTAQEAYITKITIVSYKDLVDDDITTEHDPKCRSVIGLFNVMKGIYDDFTGESVVTLISFRLK